jgi:hypothetical protein
MIQFGELMLRSILKTFVLAGWFSFAISVTAAQEIIHVDAGVLSAVDASSQTITVVANGTSQEIFNYTPDAKSVALINKKMRDGVVAVNTVKDKGTYVIIYYFINGKSRTAIGLKNLGPGPFIEEMGTVVTIEDRTLVIRNKSGEVRSFGVRSDMIAESSLGPVEGLKFQPDKGDHVRVIATAPSDGGYALFIDGTVAN